MGERLAFTFALTGRSSGFYVTQGVAWALDLLGFQPVLGRQKNPPPHFASKVSYSAAPQSEHQCNASDFCRISARRLGRPYQRTCALHDIEEFVNVFSP